MPLWSVNVWYLACDFVDDRGRRCAEARSGERGSIGDVVSAARDAGWAVSRHPGRFEVRCPAHRQRHSWSPYWRPSGVALARLAGRTGAIGAGSAEAEHSPPLPGHDPRLDLAGRLAPGSLDRRQDDNATSDDSRAPGRSPRHGAGGGAADGQAPRNDRKARHTAPAKSRRRHGRPRGSGGR